jgi:hypothetical protein
MLTARYVYPVGEDAQQRLEDHLFALFVELEGVAAPAGGTEDG